MKVSRIIIFLIFGFVASLQAQQGGLNSPFSRFGIGDLLPETPMHARQMGGLGTAFIETFHLNFDNPATLSHLQATAFNLGLNFKYSGISEGDKSSSQWSGNLGYLGLGFPLRNPRSGLFTKNDNKFNLGMGFAIMPNSTTSYNISRTEELPDIGRFTRNFRGNGGTWKAMWTNAVKYGNFSFGVNLGLLLGKIEYQRNVLFPDELNAYRNEFTNTYTVNGFYSKLGVLYLHTLNKEEVKESNGLVGAKMFSFGLTYKPNINISTTSDINNVNIYSLALDGNFSSGPATDTLNVSSGVAGDGNLPAELAFGVMYYGGSKFGVGMDFRQTFWSNYKNDANPENLEDTYKISFGGYWKPKYNDINNFFNRVSYRMGVYYEQDPRLINTERITTLGLTMGLGMPLAWQRKFSNLDIGLNIGTRSIENVLSETFAKITFGFTFNEIDWFIKRKFN